MPVPCGLVIYLEAAIAHGILADPCGCFSDLELIMTLTKQQDALATKLRDAGVPGVFAVLVASKHKYNRRGAKPKFAVVDITWWTTQLESVGYWFSFNEAWYSEFDHMEATGVRYDD